MSKTVSIFLSAVAVSLGLVGVSHAANAETVVVPNALATLEGDTSNVFPFETPVVLSHRYQQVFAASEFAARPGPRLITEIAVRPDASFGNPYPVTIDNIRINLSTTGGAPDQLSLTFADNVGADDTMVFAGSLSMTSGFIGPETGPKNFDYIIALQTPFLYDPSVGNLLLDIRNLSGAIVLQAYDAQVVLGDSVSRVFSNLYVGQDAGSPTGFADTLGLVVRFTTIPVQRPHKRPHKRGSDDGQED